MEKAFAAGRHADAVIAGIEAVSKLVARNYPPRPGARNELPDKPAVL